MRTWLLSAGIVVVLGSAGCAGASLVAARAAEELRCSEKDLTVSHREMGAYDVHGCGKQASYVIRGGEVLPDTGAHDDLPTKMPKGEE